MASRAAYVTHPLARVRLREAGGASVVVEHAPTSRAFAAPSGMLDVLARCARPRTLRALRAWLRRRGLAAEEARELVASAVEAGLLVPEGEERTGEWIARGWRAALHYHEMTCDRSFVDMGAPDDPERKRAALRGYLAEGERPDFFDPRPGAIALPDAQLPPALAGEVLLGRRTTRRFGGGAMDLGTLAAVLRVACQPARIAREAAEAAVADDPLVLTLSSYSPFEAYLLALRVQGLAPGAYRYDMRGHRLALLQEGDFEEEAGRIAIGQSVRGAAVVFLLTARHGRYMWRYRDSRALRSVYVEAAGLAHRLVLAATAAGHGTFLTPALRDSRADALLGADGFDEATVYLVAAGR